MAVFRIVEDPKRHGKSYNKWLGDQKKPSHRERICFAIDDALAQKPESFEALLTLLREAGYEVKGKKVPSLMDGEQKKFIRMDTLGPGYTPADLRAVIAGEMEHTPRQRMAPRAAPEKRSGNLLVDIQAKLRAGKGAGYARWATLFNLKQMAQTVAYLQENELLDYDTLAEKASAASARYHDISGRIKAAEKRMTEIAVMRTHIINYAKTRDTYLWKQIERNSIPGQAGFVPLWITLWGAPRQSLWQAGRSRLSRKAPRCSTRLNGQRKRAGRGVAA